jgi:hypothetical protein
VSEDEQKPIEWGKIEYSRIPKPNVDSDPKLLRQMEEVMGKALDAAMMGQIESTATKPILNVWQVAAKLREKPHTLICSWHDVLDFARKLRGYGFSFKRVRKGGWEILDKDGAARGELWAGKLQEKGQNYIIENKVLEWPKPTLTFPPLQNDGVLWSRFMKYGK